MGQKGQVWQPQATFILLCILSAGPCTYNISKFRGKPNTPVGYERLTTVSFRSRIGEALQPFPGENPYAEVFLLIFPLI